MLYDLVFEGGGAKGSVFAGALQEFESRGHRARRLVGTSAGAITAVLLASGYKSGDLLAAVNEKLPNGKPRFSSFMDVPAHFDPQDVEHSLTQVLLRQVKLLPGLGGWISKKLFAELMRLPAYRVVFSFVERGGLYAGDQFLGWLTEKLNAGGRNLGNVTLEQFHAQTGSDLSVVASDTASEQMLVLNHRTAPRCPVAWAVRMSMSIPFVWQEVRWQGAWGTYRGQPLEGDTIVDGGALSNFPLDLIISRDDEVAAIMGPPPASPAVPLGLLIDEKLPVPGAGEKPKKDEDGNELTENIERLKPVRRVEHLIDTMMKAHDSFVIRDNEGKICRLPAKGYGTTEFDLSDARLQALVDAGRAAMKEYLDIHP